MTDNRALWELVEWVEDPANMDHDTCAVMCKIGEKLRAILERPVVVGDDCFVPDGWRWEIVPIVLADMANNLRRETFGNQLKHGSLDTYPSDEELDLIEAAEDEEIMFGPSEGEST